MLSEKVYNSMLDKLLSGQLHPGEVLNRRQVAEELGVSVAPVLEAFMRLEHEGFLHTTPRKKTEVRMLTRRDIRGHLILKEAIECAAAERYTGETVKMHYDQLSLLAKKLDSESHNRNTMDAWKLDLEFHSKLVSLAGYEILNTEFNKIAVPNLFYHINQGLRIDEYLSHMELLSALTSENRTYAIDELKRHLRSGKISG